MYLTNLQSQSRVPHCENHRRKDMCQNKDPISQNITQSLGDNPVIVHDLIWHDLLNSCSYAAPHKRKTCLNWSNIPHCAQDS